MAENIATNQADGMALPGEEVALNAAALQANGMTWDENAQIYVFRYQMPNARSTPSRWKSASSVARKLQYVTRYALGGASIEEALNSNSDQAIVEVAQSVSANVVAPAPQYAFVWTVESETGGVVASQSLPLTDPNWVWSAPNNPGNYVIKAAISDDGGKTNLGAVAAATIQVPTPTFTPTPTPTDTLRRRLQPSRPIPLSPPRRRLPLRLPPHHQEGSSASGSGPSGRVGGYLVTAFKPI